MPNISEDDNIVDNAGNTMKDTQHGIKNLIHVIYI